MFAKTKLRIASRQNFDKSDIESVFGELVRIIGGTYYSGGVAVGPNNGLLDSRNFSFETGIPLSARTAPYGVFTAELPTLAAGTVAGTYSRFTAFPTGSATLYFAPIVVGLTLTNFTVSSTTNSGTCTFYYVRAGVATQIGSVVTMTNTPTTQTTLSNQTGLNVFLQPGDLLKYSVTWNVAFGSFCPIVWCKSPFIKG